MQVTPTPSSEKLLVQYLLGELPEAQCVQIEDQAFQDNEFMQEILDVESDLIDEYVRNELSAQRRSLFESHFLSSDERRRKVEFARALATVTAAKITEVSWTPAPVNPFLAFFRNLGPVTSLAFGAILILLFVIVWLAVERGRLRTELVRTSAKQQEQETERRRLEEQLAAQRKQNELLAGRLKEQPSPENVPSPKPEETPAAPLTLALTLLPGGSRGGDAIPKLEVTDQVQIIATSVVVDREETYQRFRLELRGPNGARVWSRSNLPARTTSTGKVISVNLPASVLQSGRYELAVQGNDGIDVGFYYFSASRR